MSWKPCILPRQRCLTALSLSSDRAEITILAPCFAASIASAAPMPVDAPVIQITCPFKSPLKTTIIYKNEMIDIITYTHNIKLNKKIALNTYPTSCRIYPKTLSWDPHLISVWARIWWDIWSIGLSQMPQ